MSTGLKVKLVIIDGQNDFVLPTGNLSVPGAKDDMDRLAAMVAKHGGKIDTIIATLDSHMRLHIAHPEFWINSKGQNPTPFTIISADDVKNGVWTARQFRQRALEYVQQLETNGRYPLCIWPPHCLIGSEGHAVYGPLFQALTDWEVQNFAFIDYVTKGSNLLTEHYSAIQADVPDPQDQGTQLNTWMIQQCIDADIVAWAGEAGSHCLNFTMRDTANNLGDDTLISKFVLLEDATSPVPGFESNQDQFIRDMTGRGMRISNTQDFLA